VVTTECCRHSGSSGRSGRFPRKHLGRGNRLCAPTPLHLGIDPGCTSTLRRPPVVGVRIAVSKMHADPRRYVSAMTARCTRPNAVRACARRPARRVTETRARADFVRLRHGRHPYPSRARQADCCSGCQRRPQCPRHKLSSGFLLHGGWAVGRGVNSTPRSGHRAGVADVARGRRCLTDWPDPDVFQSDAELTTAATRSWRQRACTAMLRLCASLRRGRTSAPRVSQPAR